MRGSDIPPERPAPFCSRSPDAKLDANGVLRAPGVDASAIERKVVTGGAWRSRRASCTTGEARGLKRPNGGRPEADRRTTPRSIVAVAEIRRDDENPQCGGGLRGRAIDETVSRVRCARGSRPRSLDHPGVFLRDRRCRGDRVARFRRRVLAQRTPADRVRVTVTLDRGPAASVPGCGSKTPASRGALDREPVRPRPSPP
jgi:hypothetical protein